MTVRKPQWFNEGEPPPGTACEVWCEDTGVEYRLPYQCVWRDGAWYGIGKTNPLAIRVTGWYIDMPRKKRAMS